MRFGEEERGRNGDNLNNYRASTFVCKETGDHVHYPPRQRARSPRPHHALPSWVFPSGSDLNYEAAAAAVRYRECRKNQAVEFGRTAYDGCGEFVTANEESMKCAACGCHRSFHRRDFTANCSIHRCNSGVGSGTVSAAGAVPKAKERSGGGGEVVMGTGKRFKSKFTAEQKERMRKYAVKLGWKMRKESSEEVNKFCAEIGVERVTFRNWMNNHKNNLNE